MITYDHGVMEIDTKLWLEENAYYCVLAGDECTPDSFHRPESDHREHVTVRSFDGKRYLT